MVLYSKGVHKRKHTLFKYINNYTVIPYFLCFPIIFVYSMIYGVYTQPVDFASFLVSIVILNLLMYFAFYIIMKVSIQNYKHLSCLIINMFCCYNIQLTRVCRKSTIRPWVCRKSTLQPSDPVCRKSTLRPGYVVKGRSDPGMS